MKKLLFSLSSLFALSALAGTEPTIIKGKIEGLGNNWLYLSYSKGDEWQTDSVKGRSDQFMFRLMNSEAVWYSLRGADRKKGAAGFFAESGTTTVSGKVDEMAKATATGTKAQADYLFYKDAMKEHDAKYDALIAEYRKIGEKDPNAFKLRDSLDKIYEAQNKPRLEDIKSFAKKNPSSVIGAWAIINTFYYPDANELDPVYNALTPEVQASYYGKKLKDIVESARITGIGAMAPDFSMTDSSGKVISLSSLRGKVVLLDFWASWCKPCRKENPNIVKAYDKYNAKGFTVFGVSADNKKERWTKAINDDKLTWAHVSDLKGWNNEALKLYGVKALPTNLLIDRDGKIIAKNLHGDEYEKKLAEVLK